MKNDRPPAYKHRIWWMRNKKSSLPGLTLKQHVCKYCVLKQHTSHD